MYKPNKKSVHYYASHSNDIYTDLGFNYRGRILTKTLSPVLLRNDKTRAILSNVEDILCYLIDSVKQIKLHYMFSLDKKDTNVN
jgi:hypothetical protein